MQTVHARGVHRFFAPPMSTDHTMPIAQQTISSSRQSLWMVLAAFAFSAMGVCVKLASAHYSTGEIVFYRSLIGVALMGAVLYHTGPACARPTSPRISSAACSA